MPRLHDQALALLLGAGTTTTIEAAALLLKEVQMVENLLVNVLLTADGLKKSIERSQYISEANALLCKVDSVRMLLKSLDGQTVSKSKEDTAVVEGLPTTSSCSVVS